MDYNQINGYPTNIPKGTVKFPYGNNSLLTNSPYDNYMGRTNQSNIYNQFLRCRPVSSKQEAWACQIDLDGSLWVFTDVGNDKIYTKQINPDGTATFRTYIFKEDENPYSSSSNYVTKEEFNKVVQTLAAAIQSSNTQPQKEQASAMQEQISF